MPEKIMTDRHLRGLIRLSRNHDGMSQEEAASLAAKYTQKGEFSTVWWRQVESGYRNPVLLDTIARMCYVAHVDPARIRAYATMDNNFESVALEVETYRAAFDPISSPYLPSVEELIEADNGIPPAGKQLLLAYLEEQRTMKRTEPFQDMSEMTRRRRRE